MGLFIILLTLGLSEVSNTKKYVRTRNPLKNFGADKSYADTVLFYLYTNKRKYSPQQLWNNDSRSLTASYFDKSKKTIVISHGFLDSVKSTVTKDITNAILRFQDCNVIGVDWSYYSQSILYFHVTAKVPEVGNYVGQFVNFLVTQGTKPGKIYFIGHSLGAHVSGFAGKLLNSKMHKIGRITGLDPAMPGFFGTDQASRLASTDADFVDCIHTSGLLGFRQAICQADYYPNGGDNQPGCFKWFPVFCSHGRSYQYFTESVDPTHCFYAEKCRNGLTISHDTQNNEVANMGYYAKSEFKGAYCLETGSSRPYANTIENDCQKIYKK